MVLLRPRFTTSTNPISPWPTRRFIWNGSRVSGERSWSLPAGRGDPDPGGLVHANRRLYDSDGIRTRTDWFRQRAETTYRYERWREQTLVETQLDVMAQRYWGLDEFGLPPGAARFDEVSVCGNYDRSRGVRGSDRTWTFEVVRG